MEWSRVGYLSQRSCYEILYESFSFSPITSIDYFSYTYGAGIFKALIFIIDLELLLKKCPYLLKEMISIVNQLTAMAKVGRGEMVWSGLVISIEECRYSKKRKGTSQFNQSVGHCGFLGSRLRLFSHWVSISQWKHAAFLLKTCRF